MTPCGVYKKRLASLLKGLELRWSKRGSKRSKEAQGSGPHISDFSGDQALTAAHSPGTPTVDFHRLTDQ